MNQHHNCSCGYAGLLRRNVGGLATFGLASVISGPVAVHAQQPPALVFDKVTVVDVEHGKLLPGQRVVIVGNRIQATGNVRMVKSPRGAQVVDARGKYLIPGLWDMHVHFGPPADSGYRLFLANGVTGIREMWSSVPLQTLFRWRRDILAGSRVGPPRQLIARFAIDEERPCRRGGPLQFGHICVADAADARHVVDSLKAEGVDHIKTYLVQRDVYFAIASEARRVGIPFGGHLNKGVATAIEAADSGAMILDHINTAGDLYERCLAWYATLEDGCADIAEHFRRAGTWWTPTLIRFATESAPADSLPSIGYAQMQMLGFYGGDASKAILRRFYSFVRAFRQGVPYRADWLRDPTRPAALPSVPDEVVTRPNGFLGLIARVGLPMVAGTDTDGQSGVGANGDPQPPGFALHAELALYVAEGLTPLEALRTATLNPAKAIHATDSLGTVARGKLADLVLLDANPLVDITNITMIRAVVANGRYFDRGALDHLLADVQPKVQSAN